MFKDLQTRRNRMRRPSKFRRYLSDFAGFAVTVLAAAAMLAAFAAICYATAYFARFN